MASWRLLPIVLGRAGNSYRAHFKHLVPVSLVTACGLSLLVLVWGLIWIDGLGIPLVAFVLALGIVPALNYTLQAVHVEEAAAMRAGKRTSLKESIAALRPRLPTLIKGWLLVYYAPWLLWFVAIGPSFFTSAGWAQTWTGIGALLFIGVLLSIVARWVLFVPALVIERRSIRDALRRSSELTRGRRRHVLLVMLSATVLMLGVWLFLRYILSLIFGDFEEGFFRSIYRESIVGTDSVHGFVIGVICEAVTAPLAALVAVELWFHFSEQRLAAEPAPTTEPAPVTAV
jgi:hypothetical protein